MTWAVCLQTISLESGIQNHTVIVTCHSKSYNLLTYRKHATCDYQIKKTLKQLQKIMICMTMHLSFSNQRIVIVWCLMVKPSHPLSSNTQHVIHPMNRTFINYKSPTIIPMRSHVMETVFHNRLGRWEGLLRLSIFLFKQLKILMSSDKVIKNNVFLTIQSSHINVKRPLKVLLVSIKVIKF